MTWHDWTLLSINAVTFLNVWRNKRTSNSQHKATRQHVTKSLHQHRIIETARAEREAKNV